MTAFHILDIFCINLEKEKRKEWKESLKKIISFLLSILFLLPSFCQVFASSPPKETELYAKAAVLMDADSGRILYSKNGTQALANASTTKILTCIIALENGNLDALAEISQNAAGAPKVHLGAPKGSKFLLKDLIYAMMLESFNDCAVAIAEYLAGTVENFSSIMNDYAVRIGCKDTYFITPNGLDAETDSNFHHTTAEDLALIMRYCIKQSPKSELFLKITQQAQYEFYDSEKKAQYSCYNHNAFLNMMQGALSGKTGFTGNAGYCYVGAVQQDGKTYIAALLACGWPNNKTYKWSDMKKLMEYGISSFGLKNLDDVVLEETMLAPILTESGQGRKIGEETNVSVYLVKVFDVGAVLLGDGEEITIVSEIASKLKAPIEQNTCVGSILFKVGENIVREYEVRTAEGIKQIDFYWCFDRVLEIAL